jgi:hypothetical protein
MKIKTMGDTPHYFSTAKRAERSRKFNAGVLIKKIGGPQKVNGRLSSNNPAAALPSYVE